MHLITILSTLGLSILGFVDVTAQSSNCNIDHNKDAQSAIERAKTTFCKQQIRDLACELAKQFNYSSSTASQKSDNFIYKLELKPLCNLNQNEQPFLGCVSVNANETAFNLTESPHYKHLQSSSICQKTCLTYNSTQYALFNNLTNDCYCLNNETKTLKCSNDPGEFYLYRTGLVQLNKLVDKYTTEMDQRASSTPRIVFLLSLNGRSTRQIFRLLRAIYDQHHYYLIHVDQRMDFLKDELKKFISKYSQDNIALTSWSYSTIWGGASLLEMHLTAMQELIHVRTGWDWQFLINLSESDYPIKPVKELARHLAKHPEASFLKFFKTTYATFANNQAFEFAFLQCENRMWRVGKRKAPLGIQFSGGSDWFCLNRAFVDYVVNGRDELLTNLKRYYRYSLLPSESFFHTLYLNSHFCTQSVVDNHLKLVNWKRNRGCNCQHKASVDWCGCSPNFLTLDDLETLDNLSNRPIFFVRKVDPLFNQQVINIIDQKIDRLTTLKSLNSYWHNIFSHGHSSSSVELKFKTLFRIFLRFPPLLDRLNSVETEFDLNSTPNLTLAHAFFEGDQFRGIVLNVEGPPFGYEVFFTMKRAKYLIDHFNTSDAAMADHKTFILKSIIRMEVSSDYDVKERRFVNYASVMDVNSEPALLLEFDPVEQPINLIISWLDPQQLTVKRTQVELRPSEKKQIIINKLFRADQPKKADKPGVWRIHIASFLPSHENDTFLVISKKFLILPHFEHSSDEMFMPSVQSIWELNAVCAARSLNDLKCKNKFLTGKLFEPCTNAYWSSLFPDPKSNQNI